MITCSKIAFAFLCRSAKVVVGFLLLFSWDPKPAELPVGDTMVFTLHKGELETHLRDIKQGIYHMSKQNFRNIYLIPTQKLLQDFHRTGGFGAQFVS